MAFIFEELIDSLRLFNAVKNISGQFDHNIERLVQEMTFDPELKKSNILTSNSLVIEFEKFFSDNERVDLVEFDREELLTVTIKLLKHFRVAVFETVEKNLNLFENILLWLRWVDPLDEIVEQ
jgi:hypothetical protein